MISLAGRAHPFTLATVAGSCIMLALLLPDAGSVGALCVMIAIIAITTGAGRGVRNGLTVVLPIWMLLFILQAILGDAPRMPAPWGGSLSVAGTHWMFAQGTRLTAIAIASLSFAAVFDPHAFLQAAIARRWPFDVALLVVATLDAADRLAVQARQLREAQRTRGVHIAGSIMVRIRAVPALVFPLLLASLTEAGDRSLALETRGLLLQGHRNPIDPPHDSTADRVVRWCIAIIVAGTAIWRSTR
ncbi:MAG TPA: energy-coupling factor transporter transmembrane component T [Gemmatimonadales bacterium]